MRPDVGPDGLDDPPRMYLMPDYVARVQAAGKAVGLDYTHKVRRTPNTLLAHALIGWVGETAAAKQNEVADIVFRQYHTDGLYPDEDNLVAAAAEAGLDLEAARAAITSKTRQDATAQEVVQNARATRGVPFFVVNGKRAFSGAQPPATFLEAIAAA